LVFDLWKLSLHILVTVFIGLLHLVLDSQRMETVCEFLFKPVNEVFIGDLFVAQAEVCFEEDALD